MKEDLLRTPFDPEETENRKAQFPKALEKLGYFKYLLSCTGGFFIEDKRVDGEVVKAMAGGIQRMYMYLVRAGLKDFADSTLARKKKENLI